MNPFDILKDAYNEEIADNILNSYKEIEENFVLKKWKPSELDAGHFVESVRRAIELDLFKTSTPFNKKLEDFKDTVLLKYENSKGEESIRVLIPRILKSIYGIRNKRGVGHVSNISPNEMDATYILYSVKWVLAEILRVKSNLTINDTQLIVDKIIERKIDLIWTDGVIYRILNNKIRTAQQILILLFLKNSQSISELQGSLEYKNSTNFKKLIKYLHKKKCLLIDANNICRILPPGRDEAEKTIIKYKQL